MRWPSFLRSYEFLAAVLAASAVIALGAVPGLPRPALLLGPVLGAIYYLIASRHERRRRRILLRPFPAEWREVLTRRVPLYRQLGPAEARRFEQEVQLFLGEQRIYPVQSAHRTGPPGPPGTAPPRDLWHAFPGGLSEEHRVLIAASAATLVLGRPEWRLPATRDIVVYPMPFAEDTYEIHEWGDTAGKVHAFGPIILSLPDLLRAYPVLPEAGAPPPEPGREITSNVGIHEFAHVIDFFGSQGHAGGVPGLLPAGDRERFYRQLQAERQRLLDGHSILHPYGLKNDAELFAVSVESFFLEPVRLRAHHPEWYELLREFFNQDPAARAVPPLPPLLYRPWFSLSTAPVRYTA